MNRLLTVAVLFLPTISAFSQEAGTPKEVTKFGWLVGTWSASGKIAFGSNEAKITTTMTVSFEGQFLKEVSVDDSGQYKLTKTTFTGWDAAKGQYDSYTFTNIAPKARIAHGKADGNKLVMVSEPWEAEGMKLVSRETVSKISDSKCGLMVEAEVGGKWQTEMNFVLTKK